MLYSPFYSIKEASPAGFAMITMGHHIGVKTTSLPHQISSYRPPRLPVENIANLLSPSNGLVLYRIKMLSQR